MFRKKKEETEKVKFFSTKRTTIKAIKDGIPGIPEGYVISICLMSDHILITGNKKLPEIALPFPQITSFGTIKEDAFQNKSSIGRAAVGGLLLGPLGAVVGAVSGTGQKKKQKVYLVINYVSSSGEEAALTAELIGPNNTDTLKFTKGLKQYARCFNDPAPETVGKRVTL